MVDSRLPRGCRWLRRVALRHPWSPHLPDMRPDTASLMRRLEVDASDGGRSSRSVRPCSASLTGSEHRNSESTI